MRHIACSTLPREPEDLVRTLYNYFSNSPKRSGQLKQFQEFLTIKPHKLLHPCQTRWLSLQSAVLRLLEQYDALKLFFTDAAFTDRLNSADSILRMLNNPYNKLYLEFLEFSLNFFNNLNKMLQSEKPQIHNLHENLCNTFRSLLDCYIDTSYLMRTDLSNIPVDNPRHYKPVEELYLGIKVATGLSNPMLTPNDVKIFKLHCLEFFIEGAKQIKSRYDFSNETVKNLFFFNPANIKQGSAPTSILHIAQKFPRIIPENKYQMLDNEWRHLRLNESIIKFKENDMEKFWVKVFSAMNPSDGNILYPTLRDLITSLISLPHSTAAVERIFSSIDLIKTNVRNSLSTETIESLILTKQLIKSNNKWCYSFSPDINMINKMKNNMYK